LLYKEVKLTITLLKKTSGNLIVCNPRGGLPYEKARDAHLLTEGYKSRVLV